MIERAGAEYAPGYTPLTEVNGRHAEMLLDFGILVLEAGETYRDADRDRERAYMLLDGAVRFRYGGHEVAASRGSLLDEGPWTLHASAGTQIEIAADRKCELVVERVPNAAEFPAHVYSPAETRSEEFGHGTMRETSTRTVRTVFDAATHSKSGMVLGEVVNHPGKWSSYPPHSHAHPEVYHYRFFPENGFGFSEVGDDVYRVRNRDTVMIPGGVLHPQTAAPGYAMYYVWMIPHLPGNKFGPDSRIFDPAYTWVTDPNAHIWP